MKVQPINSNIYKSNFKANARWVCDKNGTQLYKTTTYCFRDDLIWKDLIKFISKKFKDTPKVNFINHACSNGMESFSFLMALMVYSPADLEKFTPILAKDIDYHNINEALKGSCGISGEDFLRINRNTDNKHNNFIDIQRANDPEYLFVMKPKEFLKRRIRFEQGDILKDVEKFPPENTFLSCRNLWMYLSPCQREELAYKLGKQLNSNSTILLGFLDVHDGKADQFLTKNGFKRCPTGSEFVNIMYSKT